MEFELDFVIGLGFFLVVSICLTLGAKILRPEKVVSSDDENDRGLRTGFVKRLLADDGDFYCFFHKDSLYKDNNK